jgi:hypothetical protein
MILIITDSEQKIKDCKNNVILYPKKLKTPKYLSMNYILQMA